MANVYCPTGTEVLIMSSENPKNVEKKALYSLVKALCGDRLSEKELEEVRLGVETIVENAYALRAVKLENSDEPSMLFKPYRKSD